MIHPEATAGDSSKARTAADNATVRTVFVIGPDKKLKLNDHLPDEHRAQFDEILRVLDSLQLTAKHQVATPVNWKQGRGRDHRAGGFGRRGEGQVPRRLERAQALSQDRAAARWMMIERSPRLVCGGFITAAVLRPRGRRRHLYRRPSLRLSQCRGDGR